MQCMTWSLTASPYSPRAYYCTRPIIAPAHYCAALHYFAGPIIAGP